MGAFNITMCSYNLSDLAYQLLLCDANIIDCGFLQIYLCSVRYAYFLYVV